MSASVTREERARILEGLTSSSEEVRRLSVEQLLLLQAEEAAPRFCECLGDPGWRVRKRDELRMVAAEGEVLSAFPTLRVGEGLVGRSAS